MIKIKLPNIFLKTLDINLARLVLGYCKDEENAKTERVSVINNILKMVHNIESNFDTIVANTKEALAEKDRIIKEKDELLKIATQQRADNYQEESLQEPTWIKPLPKERFKEIKKNLSYWTNEEMDLLINNFDKMKPKELALFLSKNLNRAYNACLLKVYGLKQNNARLASNKLLKRFRKVSGKRIASKRNKRKVYGSRKWDHKEDSLISLNLDKSIEVLKKMLKEEGYNRTNKSISLRRFYLKKNQF